MAWFLIFVVLLGAGTAAQHGWGPFTDFVHNMRHVYEANGINYRDNSIDSLFRAAAGLAGLAGGWIQGAIWLVKAALAVLLLRLVSRNVRHRSFCDEPGLIGSAWNALPGLLLLMTLLSPLIWEHHGVLAGLSFLVCLKGLDSSRDWLLFGSAYGAVFLVPTFDFFPWSYGRLAGLLACGWLLSRQAKDRVSAPWFDSFRSGEAGMRVTPTGRPPGP
jgi:hypothetical protein